MTRKTKTYSKEFKSEAIKLALDSETVSQAAKDLGMPVGTLHTWLNDAKLNGMESVKLSNGESDVVNVVDLMAENKALKRRLSRLEQEKSILKKAAAYFAKELG